MQKTHPINHHSSHIFNTVSGNLAYNNAFRAPLSPKQSPPSPKLAPLSPTQARVSPTQAPLSSIGARHAPTQAPLSSKLERHPPTKARVLSIYAPLSPKQASHSPKPAPLSLFCPAQPIFSFRNPSSNHFINHKPQFIN